MFDLLSAVKDNMQGRMQEEELHKEEQNASVSLLGVALSCVNSQHNPALVV